MTLKQLHIGKLFLSTALLLLMTGMMMGIMAAIHYLVPGFTKNTIDFSALRPLHVSAVVFWILLGATGCLYSYFQERNLQLQSNFFPLLHWMLWIVGIAGILASLSTKQFGGREYWEADPAWSVFIIAAWLIFLINFIRMIRRVKSWPVYAWMWMTGVVFFLFTFLENYLWLFPWFRETIVTDMTIQWKVNGSLVGAWNQLIYGTAFFLMDRIEPSRKVTRSRLVFAMYFLGLFNLMFNWGHHIYTLPTAPYIRYIGYAVSMTEWIIFLRIVFNWKGSVSEVRKHYHYFPYRFLMASDIWVAINLFQALLMSVPAINLYTHGTHITVAHAMGTTIGINTMILMAACYYFLGGTKPSGTRLKWLNLSFWTAQVSLFIFWLSLITAGVIRAVWQHEAIRRPFKSMMQDSLPWFAVFFIAGILLTASLSLLAVHLLIRKEPAGSKSNERDL